MPTLDRDFAGKSPTNADILAATVRDHEAKGDQDKTSEICDMDMRIPPAQPLRVSFGDLLKSRGITLMT